MGNCVVWQLSRWESLPKLPLQGGYLFGQLVKKWLSYLAGHGFIPHSQQNLSLSGLISCVLWKTLWSWGSVRKRKLWHYNSCLRAENEKGCILVCFMSRDRVAQYCLLTYMVSEKPLIVVFSISCWFHILYLGTLQNFRVQAKMRGL